MLEVCVEDVCQCNWRISHFHHVKESCSPHIGRGLAVLRGIGDRRSGLRSRMQHKPFVRAPLNILVGVASCSDAVCFVKSPSSRASP